jgi:hypothetical protein
MPPETVGQQVPLRSHRPHRVKRGTGKSLVAAFQVIEVAAQIFHLMSRGGTNAKPNITNHSQEHSDMVNNAYP